MRLAKGLTFLTLSLSLMAGTSFAETIELDIETALNRAAEANFQILLGQEAVTAQEENTRLSRSGLLPQVTLEAAQSRRQVPTFGPFADYFTVKRYFTNSFDAVLRARLALVDTRSWDDWKLSKLTLQATREQLENTVQEIQERIAIAYLLHWRNQKRLNVLDSILERDRILLKVAKDQADAGVATTLEVTRAEVRLNQNELARIVQETAVMESALNLKRILNYPLDADLVLKTQIDTVPPEVIGFTDEDFETILNSRADYRSLQAELERSQVAANAVRREHLPSLYVSGDWGYAAENWDDSQGEQWSVQLGLSMPVFEGFRIDANKQIADSQLRQKEIEMADLRSQIEADYRLVLQRLSSAYRQVEVARRSRELSNREFELERIRFEEGVTDNSDVVLAQANLADAEDTVVAAEYEYFLTFINLARTRGDIRRIIYWLEHY